MIVMALAVVVVPVIVGLLGIFLPAAGYFPALGFTQLSTHPADLFFSTPGVGPAIWLALKTGLIASLLSLLCCFVILTGLIHTSGFSLLRRALAALVAVPHSAMAIGLVFLLAPSGWLIRILSPAITGLDRPPDWNLVPDPYGWGLILGLMAKENLIWLGGTDEFEEGKWTWDNGEPFKFKHWDENQPAGTNGFNFLILRT